MKCKKCGKTMNLKNFNNGRCYVCESCKIRYQVKSNITNSQSKKAKNTQKSYILEASLITFSFILILVALFSDTLAIQLLAIFLTFVNIFVAMISFIIKICSKPAKNPRTTPLQTASVPNQEQNIIFPNNKTSDTSTISQTPNIPNLNDALAQMPESTQINSPVFKTENFHIAGTSFRQKEIEQLGTENNLYDEPKKELVDMGIIDEKIYFYDFFPKNVELIPEPDNEYDPNAIKVIIDNIHIGYIKKGSCSHVKKLLASGKIKGINAEIHGGKYKIIFEEYDYEKDRDIYIMESDKTDYFVSISIKYDI